MAKRRRVSPDSVVWKSFTGEPLVLSHFPLFIIKRIRVSAIFSSQRLSHFALRTFSLSLSVTLSFSSLPFLSSVIYYNLKEKKPASRGISFQLRCLPLLCPQNSAASFHKNVRTPVVFDECKYLFESWRTAHKWKIIIYAKREKII